MIALKKQETFSFITKLCKGLQDELTALTETTTIDNVVVGITRTEAELRAIYHGDVIDTHAVEEGVVGGTVHLITTRATAVRIARIRGKLNDTDDYMNNDIYMKPVVKAMYDVSTYLFGTINDCIEADLGKKIGLELKHTESFKKGDDGYPESIDITGEYIQISGKFKIEGGEPEDFHILVSGALFRYLFDDLVVPDDQIPGVPTKGTDKEIEVLHTCVMALLKLDNGRSQGRIVEFLKDRFI